MIENYGKDINENESKNDLFNKIKSIHDYFIPSKNNSIINKNNNYQNKDSNIYIKYLDNPNIIFQKKDDINNENLKLLFNELNKDMDDGNNILFPFLDVCQNLVKAYIESDLDDIIIDEEEKITSISDSLFKNI